MLHERFPSLKNNIILGVSCKTSSDSNFDEIVNRGALTCNNVQATTDYFRNCYNRLSEGGKYQQF